MIRISNGRMTINTGSNKKKGKSIGKLIGTIMIVFGCLFTLVGIGITLFMANFSKNIPDDAQWYKATVVEVINVDKKVERKESSNNRYRYETTYDCDVYLEYEIEGVNQRIRYSINGSYDLLGGGETYYVKVSPSNPSKIYVFSNEPDDSFFEGGLIFLAVVGIITIIVGVLVRKIAKSAIVVDRAINYGEDDGVNYNDMNYNNTYGSTDYSGTSIDKLN